MCLDVNPAVKSLNARKVWKIFDRPTPRGPIVSLYLGCPYPLNKKVVRDRADPPNNIGIEHGIHVFLKKSEALEDIRLWRWSNAYIAELTVDPKDFLGVDYDGTTAAYISATRVGKFIRVTGVDGKLVPVK